MPVTIRELPAQTKRTLLQYKDGVPMPPPPYAASIEEYLLNHVLGNPEVFTKGVLYRTFVPGVGERWLATIVVTYAAVGFDATFSIGKTFEVTFPDDMYDRGYDDDLESLLRAEL